MSRILILTPQFPYPPQALTGRSQGTTLRNFNLIAGLSHRHTVDLLTFVEGDGDAADLVRGLEMLTTCCRRVVTAPLPVRSTRRRALDTVRTPLPDMALRLDAPEMHARLAEMLIASQYDVLQAEGIEMAPYVLRLPRDRRPFVVFDNHNAEYLLQKRTFQTDVRRPRRWVGAAYSLAQWRKLAAYERRVCMDADRVITVSEADRTALLALEPGLSVTVVPNGVDLEFYRPGAVGAPEALGPGALVFTGKMDYRPNVDAVTWFAHSVLPVVKQRNPEAHFWAVGQQPHARLSALSGREDVTITGRVPDVRPYIAGAGAYVVPLRIGGGTRLKVLEAMAMGQALVSTRLGCDGFDFTDGRELRFADTPEQFAEVIEELLRDRATAAELGRNARARVEANYGWQSIIPRLESVYP
jgi:sugar transferase (PEP-CTERM/EpsH1 system associated)